LERVSKGIREHVKREGDYSTSRPPLLKRGKSGMFEQYKKKGILMVSFHQQPSGRMMSGQTH